MSAPETRYAKSGDVNVAYQVVGEGPFDLVYVPGWISNIELMWEEPTLARLLRRLASFSRLILFDKPGTGMSDPVPLDRLPTLEQRMDAVRAVMDAAGSERAALFGSSEGGLMSVLFAATYPERTRALVTLAIYAKRLWSADYPWAPTPEARAAEIKEIEASWGGRDGHLESRAKRRRGIQAASGGIPPSQREPRRRRRAAAHELQDRRSRRAADDPGSDTRAPASRRP